MGKKDKYYTYMKTCCQSPGPTGPSGLSITGPTGPAGAGIETEQIIAYSSDTSFAIGSGFDGTPAAVAAIGFYGSRVFTITVPNEITTVSGAIGNFSCSFVAPRDGILNSIYCYVSTGFAAINVTGDITVFAEMYQSTNNVFTPVPGSEFALTPTLSGPTIAGGTILTGSLTNAGIPIVEGTRYMYVIKMTSTDLFQTLTALVASGSIGIL